MARDKWQRLEEARRVLGLPEKATILEIKAQYRRLSLETHPDHQGDAVRQQRLNQAYRLLMDYCERYRITLTPNEDGADPEDWWFLHFGQDPIWSGDKGKE